MSVFLRHARHTDAQEEGHMETQDDSFFPTKEGSLNETNSVPSSLNSSSSELKKEVRA